MKDRSAGQAVREAEVDRVAGRAIGSEVKQRIAAVRKRRSSQASTRSQSSAPPRPSSPR